MSDHIKTWTAQPRAQHKKSAATDPSRHGDLFPPAQAGTGIASGTGSGAGGSGGMGNSGGAGGGAKPPRSPRSVPPPRTPRQRLLRRVVLGAAVVLGLVLCVLGWLTSPLGEKTLTALTLNMGNKALASSGLRMELHSVRGLWLGEVRVMGLKLLDKDGLWLELTEGVVQPHWGSVARNVLDGARMVQKLKLSQDPTGPGLMLVQVTRATFFDLTVHRPPVLTADSTAPVTPGAVRILPQWLEVDVDELEISRLAYGPEGKRLHANVLANVSMSDAQVEARMGLYLSSSSQRLKAAPIPEILPDDVTLSRREIEEREAKAQAEAEASARAAAQNAQANGNQPGQGLGQSGQGLGQGSPPPAGAAAQAGQSAQGAGQGQMGQGQTGQPQTGQGQNMQGQTAQGQTAQGQTPPRPQNLTEHTQLLLNVVWDGVFADIRWQARDTMLLPHIFPGVQRLWSRARIQVNMPQWPPDKKNPLQARMASRFGLTVTELTERVKASLSSGQMLWDGQKLVVRDVDLQIPMREPRILVQGSAGLSRESGPGMRVRMDLTDLGSLVRTLGLKHLEQIVGGEAVGRFAVGRGGRHTLWWTRPLPEPAGFAENPLPGFTAAPLPPELARLEAAGLLNDHIANSGENGSGTNGGNGGSPADSTPNSASDNPGDSSGAAASKATVSAPERVSVTRTVHDPRASRVPTALHTRVSLDSPRLQLPGGTVEGLSLVLRGTSVDADKAPDGTMRRKAVENAAKIKDTGGDGGTAGAKGKAAGSAPSTGTGAGTGAGAGAGAGADKGEASQTAANSAAPKVTDSDSDDFAASGLPRGMVGKLELKAASLFGMGDANLAAQWLLAGLHGDADVLLMEFSQLAGTLPGFSLGGDVELSYGLPLRRPWPWLDGTLKVAVDNWQALSRLVKSPVQGGGMGLDLRMESRFNEKNEPRQYLRADVQAKLVDAPTFSVHEVRGNVESDHAHALADLFSLAFSPASRRKVSPDGPPPLDYDLLKARLQLGSGTGGPLQWSSGLCTLNVAGEDARIDANLKGNIRGTLEGIFNFRKRVLQIQKMEVSQGEGAQKMALRLQNPLKATLHEDGALEPVDVGLTYGTAPEATARLKASLQPLKGRAASVTDPAASGAEPASPGADTPARPRDTAASGANPAARPMDTAAPRADTAASGAEPASPGAYRMLQAEATVWGLPGQNAAEAGSPSALHATLALPLRFAPLPALLPASPLNGEARWQGQLEPLWKLLPLPGRSLRGEASLQLGLGGSLDKPLLRASASLREGQYVDRLEGVRLQDMALRMDYGGRDLSRFSLSAADGRGGTLALTGTLFQQNTALMVNAAGTLNRLRPLHRDDLRLTLSGDLALRGPLLGVMPPLPPAATAMDKRDATGAATDKGKGKTTGRAASTAAGTTTSTTTGTAGGVETGKAASTAAGVAGGVETGKAAGTAGDVDAGAAAAPTADTQTVTGTVFDTATAQATVTETPEGTVGAQGGMSSSGAAPGTATQGSPPQHATAHGGAAQNSAAPGNVVILPGLPNTALPSRLLLSGNLRLDEGSFQLLQGFTPSVASLEGVSAGSAPPPLTKEWLQQAGFALAQAKAAQAPTNKAVTKTVKPTARQAVKERATKSAAADPAVTTTAWVTPVPELQLSLVAPGRFFISGKGLDSEWRANLNVQGSARAPRLTGSLSPVRGTFELLNRQFRFEKGGIHCNGAWPPNPSLDLALGYQSAQITALVEVQGSAQRPRLNLTSQPPLPRDEVMAQVLFGKSLGSLSRFETIQAANAARQLADAGPSALDVLSGAKDLLGLQVLRLGSGSAPAAAKSAPRDASVQGKNNEGQDLGTTLEAGKYITDSVYVGVEQGTRPEAGTAVRVEVELTPNISLSGRTSQESSGVGLNWKMDY